MTNLNRYVILNNFINKIMELLKPMHIINLNLKISIPVNQFMIYQKMKSRNFSFKKLNIKSKKLN